MRKLFLSAFLAAVVTVGGFWLYAEPGGKPLVCEQISPGVKHAKRCSPEELKRLRAAYLWVSESVEPTLSGPTMAAVASFIEDTGRRKRTTFYRILNRGDIPGACEQILAYVDRRGEPDPERVKRREHERALCLSKG